MFGVRDSNPCVSWAHRYGPAHTTAHDGRHSDESSDRIPLQVAGGFGHQPFLTISLTVVHVMDLATNSVASRFDRRRALKVSAGVAAAVVTGCGAVLAVTTPLSSSSSTLPKTTVAQGTSFTDGGLTMTVTDSAKVGSVPDLSQGWLFTARIWGPWVIAKVRVANRSPTAQFFSPMFQRLLIDGTEYDPKPGPAEDAYSSSDSAASISPGLEVDVALAFELAHDSDADDDLAQPVQLVLRGDLDSPGAVVDLPIT